MPWLDREVGSDLTFDDIEFRGAEAEVVPRWLAVYQEEDEGMAR